MQTTVTLYLHDADAWHFAHAPCVEVTAYPDVKGTDGSTLYRITGTMDAYLTRCCGTAKIWRSIVKWNRLTREAADVYP